MDGDVGGLRDELDKRLGRRGWRFHDQADLVRGRASEWPHQLELLVDPGAADRVPSLGLSVNFDAMPLGGERFRDILNADREELLFSYGAFRLRQQLKDGSWIAEIGHRAFVHGYGSGSGISRRTAIAVFDRCPTEKGMALADRMLTDLSRIAETGAAFAATLQRIYQRTVLAGVEAGGALPDVIGRGQAQGATPDAGVGWRRGPLPLAPLTQAAGN